MPWPNRSSAIFISILVIGVGLLFDANAGQATERYLQDVKYPPELQELPTDDKSIQFLSPPDKDPKMSLPEAQPEETPEAFEARIQKHIVPRAFLYQQTVFSRYPRYRQKIQPTLEALRTLANYLKNLNESEAPDIQLLSAKANLLKLQWELLARDIEPHEAEYHSYAHITDAVAGLVNIADYWVKADKNRGVNRPTIGAMADDITYWAQMRATVLNEIDTLDAWQDDEAAISHKPSRLPPPPFP